VGALGSGCLRGCGARVGTVLPIDWPSPEVTLLREIRRMDRHAARISTAGVK
jgi:hypothetical protein